MLSHRFPFLVILFSIFCWYFVWFFCIFISVEAEADISNIINKIKSKQNVALIVSEDLQKIMDLPFYLP